MTDDELRALATAAGAKEWRAGTSERWHVFEWTVDDVLGSHERVIARTNDNLDGFERLTNFIAAANPARVLSLLDRAQRAEAELAALRRVGREGDGAMNAIEILTADRDDWKRRAERAEAERDRAEERVMEGEQLRLSAEIAEQHAKDDLRKAEAERDELREERRRAAGELRVSLDDAPIGSVAGDLLVANRALRSVVRHKETETLRALAQIDELTAERDAAVRERDEAMAEVEQLRAALARIAEWTHVYGNALCPHGADTYGEGMRDAKDQVRNLIKKGTQ